MQNLLFWVFLLPMFAFCFKFTLIFLSKLLKQNELERLFSYTLTAGNEPTVDILMSCFNEGAQVLDTINSLLNMNYPYHKMRIIVVDDYSTDDSVMWVEKAKATHPKNVFLIKNKINSGKALNIAKCVKVSSADFVMCVDSDALFHKDCLRNLVMGFSRCSNDKVAAVGGKIGVLNADTNMITRVQTMLYFFVFHFFKVAETTSKTVDCLSGCLVLVKRSCYLEVLDRVLKRTWMGLKPTDGEDRFLTSALIAKGYYTLYNKSALCWTKVPDNLTQLFNQQVRWKRGMLREWFNVLFHFNEYVKSYNIFVFLFNITSHLMIMVIPIIIPITYIMTVGSSGWIKIILIVIGFLGFAGISGRILFHLLNKHHPEQKISSYIEYMLVPLWMALDAVFITLLTICTLDYEGWGGTREIKIKTTDKQNTM
jgi:cellulose synthase/poly-beta-1,6-N-acetylglucosamine synthase-like glycosyltransferase